MEHFDKVLLLNESCQGAGLCDKTEAHRKGFLHLAFSVFIFDSRGNMLIQKRAKGKYHSGGLWSNACCSHPTDPDGVVAVAKVRLKQEMGFDCPLEHLFSFGYRADFTNGVIEDEWDMVLAGIYDGPISPNPEEAENAAWVPIPLLLKDVKAEPKKYTVWFREAVSEAVSRFGREKSREVAGSITKTIFGREVTLTLSRVGKDLVLLCSGGDEPHIGSVSLAAPPPGSEKLPHVSVSSVSAPGHRDDDISAMLARKFCKAVGVVVSVSCGIHFDSFSPEMIPGVRQGVEEMGGELLERLAGDPIG